MHKLAPALNMFHERFLCVCIKDYNKATLQYQEYVSGRINEVLFLPDGATRIHTYFNFSHSLNHITKAN